MTENSDIHSFTQLFNQHNSRFVAFAVTYVGSRSVAEDIVMDSFLYYWERRASLGHNQNPQAYILTAVKHKCLNHLRNRAIHARVEENMASVSQQALKVRISTLEALNPDEIFSEEVQLAVRTALNSLPQKTRDIFLQSRIYDRTYKQIAEEFSISVKSVEFEISKATRMLRERLRDSSLYLSMLVMIDMGLITM